MDETRKTAKQFLSDAPLSSFWSVVSEAKLTDEDREVLDLKFVHGKANVEISLDLGMSLEKVNKIIRRSYEKIARLL